MLVSNIFLLQWVLLGKPLPPGASGCCTCLTTHRIPENLSLPSQILNTAGFAVELGPSYPRAA